ncbi:hypothetical protein SLS57_001204 [Botryosphaeria dothidea]
MSDPGEYTVGWICAIPTEQVAARQFLDEEHKPPTVQSTTDNNSYILGKIGGHNVVIAVLPMGEYGTISAASVARDMLHTFSNIRFGLMVGIGGGAPSKEHDIRLGDVVVSCSGNGKGGVLQYDYGKAIQGLGFQKTGFLNQPPQVLSTAVATLRGRHISDGNEIEEDILAVFAKKKKKVTREFKKFRRPPNDTDRLYRSTCIHPAGSNSSKPCTETCEGKSKRKSVLGARFGGTNDCLVAREDRDADEDNPAVHYGLIASANQLMKDAKIRDELSEAQDVLCFEMEAAGLMNHFPCLVIRGICDYSDSHKNKDWQGYAAMTAAAYAKSLLHQISPSRVKQEKTFSKAIDSLTKSVNDATKSVEAMRERDLKLEITRWLSPCDVFANFNKAICERFDGSGKWLFKSDTFWSWMARPKSFLCLRGIPGCGKTILAASIVEYLDTECLYFFFDFADKEKQTLDQLLRSLIDQLYSRAKLEGPRSVLEKEYLAGSHQRTTEQLKTILEDMLYRSQGLKIALDTLDECSTKMDVISWLQELPFQKH